VGRGCLRGDETVQPSILQRDSLSEGCCEESVKTETLVEVNTTIKICQVWNVATKQRMDSGTKRPLQGRKNLCVKNILQQDSVTDGRCGESGKWKDLSKEDFREIP
jgi:hypothetical protein